MRIRRLHRDMTSRWIGAGLIAVAAGALAAALLSPQATARPAASARQAPGEVYVSMGFGVFMHYGLATFVGKTPWDYDPHDVPATVYGSIAGIWLDIAPLDDVQLPELSDFVHSESPATAFVPNFPNAMLETDAADVRTFEGPGELMPCGYEGKPAEQAYTVAAGPGWWQTNDDPPTRSAEEIRALWGKDERSGSDGVFMPRELNQIA